MKAKATDQLVRIVAAGGGLDFQASAKSTDQLVRIAAAAAQSGSRVVLRGMGSKSTDQLVRIAAAGKGRVIFAD